MDGHSVSRGRARWLVLLAVVILVATGTAAYAVSAFQAARSSQSAPSCVELVTASPFPPHFCDVQEYGAGPRLRGGRHRPSL